MKCQNLLPFARYFVCDDVEVLHTEEQAAKKYLHNDNVTYSCETPGCDSGVAKDSSLLGCYAALFSKHFPHVFEGTTFENVGKCLLSYAACNITDANLNVYS